MEGFLQEILPCEFYRTLTTTTFCATQIHSKECKCVIEKLSKLCPLPSHLKHLKRVRKASYQENCFFIGKFDDVECGTQKIQNETCFVLLAENEVIHV
jgi:hypothetical protein